jgi:hypothetical protein
MAVYVSKDVAPSAERGSRPIKPRTHYYEAQHCIVGWAKAAEGHRAHEFSVIASEAKQSRATRDAPAALDCFVASLLAKTIRVGTAASPP